VQTQLFVALAVADGVAQSLVLVGPECAWLVQGGWGILKVEVEDVGHNYQECERGGVREQQNPEYLASRTRGYTQGELQVRACSRHYGSVAECDDENAAVGDVDDRDLKRSQKKIAENLIFQEHIHLVSVSAVWI
jgi:hypothetical protein